MPRHVSSRVEGSTSMHIPSVPVPTPTDTNTVSVGLVRGGCVVADSTVPGCADMPLPVPSGSYPIDMLHVACPGAWLSVGGGLSGLPGDGNRRTACL